jgi:Uncharacterized protein conserved in bacteria
MSERTSPPTIVAGLRCRCPRCGEGRVFEGFLKVAPACDNCGLDLSFADPADGPAFFVMSGVAVIVTTFWGVWAVMAQPPIWAQLAVVFPALIIGCLGALRPVKAWMVAEQYVHRAEEARWESTGTHGRAPKGYKPSGR